MKTRNQAAITMEQVTPDPSCSKRSTALTSTELSRLWRQAIYNNEALHLNMKKKDRERKKMKAVEMVKIRQEYLKEAEEYWENEMMKKRKQ